MKFKSDLHAGRAGEHLAAADIIAQGHECFHAAQGMPYDLIADIDNRLLRVQVKTTRKPEILPQRAVNNLAYRFWVSRCGKEGRERYSGDDVDLFALVCLDTKEVGFLGVKDMVRTLFVRPESNRGKHNDEVVVARNLKILELLTAGGDPAALAEQFNLTANYIKNIKSGKARSHIASCYMSDLTLGKALASV